MTVERITHTNFVHRRRPPRPRLACMSSWLARRPAAPSLVVVLYSSLLLLLIILSSCNLVSSYNPNTVADQLVIKPDGSHVCPTCEMVDSNVLHRIVNCEKFVDTQTQYARTTPFLKSLPSYKCQCKYLKESNCAPKNNKKAKVKKSNANTFQQVLDANSRFEEFVSDEELNQEVPIEYESTNVDCLVAHVGMSIKSNNLAFKKWKNKEHCYNLCLKTTIKNGHQFDCRSFEHWHKDCYAQIPDANGSNGEASKDLDDTAEKLCASFDAGGTDKRNSYFADHIHHNPEHSNGARHKRGKYKMDICVLSNMTIQMAGSDFVPNNALTYYELLCQRPANKPAKEGRKPQDPNKMHSKSIRTTTAIITTTTQPIEKSTPIRNKNRNKSTSRSKVPKTTKEMTIINENEEDFDIEANDESRRPSKNDADGKGKNGNKIPKNIFTGSTTTEVAPIVPKKCKFDPCQNGATCVLREVHHFKCQCQPFYYGIYCEYPGIQKFCHKNYMEIVLFQEIANDMKLKITDIFVNEKKNPPNCRLNILNNTHASFKIPYQKCSTAVKNTPNELIATNKLLSSTELGERFQIDYANKHLINEYECRVDLSPEPKIDPSKHASKPAENGENVECIINLLNLNLKMFYDEGYSKEMIIDSANLKHNKYAFKYNQQLFVQFSVEYSDRLDHLLVLQDRLQYFHLTIQRCWLTKTQNEDRHILQILIDNGCPKRRVSFYDTSAHRNAIRFSFFLSDEVRRNMESQFYIHCLPEICTDPPKNTTDLKFYSQFKSCHNISHPCNLDPSVHPNELSNDKGSVESSRETAPLVSGPNNCVSKLAKGPVVITDKGQRPAGHAPEDASFSIYRASNLVRVLLAVIFSTIVYLAL